MHGLFKLSLLAAAASLCNASFKDGCADAKWNSDTDYWLHKFDKDDNLPFKPIYNNTFVKIKNRQARYVVLHCTKEAPPISEVGEGSLIVQVPVKNVAALDGFSQNMIEMLGLSTSIKRTGVYAEVTSSCVRGNMMDKTTFDDDHWNEAPSVEVTFHGDTELEDGSKVLIYNTGLYAPLTQLAYIKFVSMFFGVEELGARIYDELSASYRCAAAHVQQAILAGTYPRGAFVSPVRREADGKMTVFQGAWWNTILSDAGARMVNASADGEVAGRGAVTVPEAVTIQSGGVGRGSTIGRTSWAIIDTTQYDQLPGKAAPEKTPHAERVTEKTYATRSGADKDIYAVSHNNVFLTDKASNRNMRHNFFDRGTARPDLALRDIISVISPATNPATYTTQFIRAANNPDDEIALRRYANTCAVAGREIATLNVTACTMPGWVTGFNSTGLAPNAFGREEPESMALTAKADGLSGGEKAGIAVGSIVGGLLVLAGVLFGVWRWRRAAAAKKQQQQREMNQVEKGSVVSE